MTKRYLVGGPSNSGKSTFALSLVKHLNCLGISAEAVELDVWGNSYPAFRGEVPFHDRPKHKDFNWNWESALRGRLKQFQGSEAKYVFGDMPGKLGRASAFICDNAKPDGAIVVSRSLEGVLEWRRVFEDWFFPIVAEILTMMEMQPIIVVGMDRVVSGDKPDIRSFAEQLINKEAGVTTAKIGRRATAR